MAAVLSLSGRPSREAGASPGPQRRVSAERRDQAATHSRDGATRSGFEPRRAREETPAPGEVAAAPVPAAGCTCGTGNSCSGASPAGQSPRPARGGQTRPRGPAGTAERRPRARQNRRGSTGRAAPRRVGLGEEGRRGAAGVSSPRRQGSSRAAEGFIPGRDEQPRRAATREDECDECCGTAGGRAGLRGRLAGPGVGGHREGGELGQPGPAGAQEGTAAGGCPAPGLQRGQLGAVPPAPRLAPGEENLAGCDALPGGLGLHWGLHSSGGRGSAGVGGGCAPWFGDRLLQGELGEAAGPELPQVASPQAVSNSPAGAGAVLGQGQAGDSPVLLPCGALGCSGALLKPPGLGSALFGVWHVHSFYFIWCLALWWVLALGLAVTLSRVKAQPGAAPVPLLGQGGGGGLALRSPIVVSPS